MNFNRQASEVLKEENFWEEKPELSRYADTDKVYPFEKCLRPLLAAVNWGGQDRHILQSLPVDSYISDPAELSAVMNNLGYQIIWQEKKVASLRYESGTAVVLLEKNYPLIAQMHKVTDEKNFLAYDVMREDHICVDFDETKALIGLVKPIQEDSSSPDTAGASTWFQVKSVHLRPALLSLMFSSFIINTMAISTPLYVMSVYNVVIAPKELETLWFFTAAILASAWLEYYFRLKRGHIISYVGARFISVMMIEAFMRVISLPLAFFAKAPTSGQVERFKQFGNSFSFFRAGLITILMDLPFLVIFLGMIWLLGGFIIWIPICIAMAFTVLGIVTHTVRKQTSAQFSSARIQLHNMAFETFENAESIRQIQAENRWTHRYSSRLHKYLSVKNKNDVLDIVLRGISQYLVAAGGVLCLSVGAMQVMAAEMSIGALIALMMMIWRILSPIQMVFLSWLQISYLRATVQQVNQLMRLKEDRKIGQPSIIVRNMQGNIFFKDVVLRYPDKNEPVLNGLNVKISAGELTCIGSPPKSQFMTGFIDSLLSLAPIQAGDVYIDELNLKQLDIEEIRHMISLVMPEPCVFQGTIAQNIRFGAMTASVEDITHAAKMAGLTGSFLNPDTQLTFGEIQALPDEIAYRISLARAYCRSAKIYIFCDPVFQQTDRLVEERVKAMQYLHQTGATVIMFSNREEIFDISERAIVIADGRVVADATPEELKRQREEALAQRALQEQELAARNAMGQINGMNKS
jgi:ATP-binding cassette subfamily C protein/ATP-binding cassette subfamily C protein LapB